MLLALMDKVMSKKNTSCFVVGEYSLAIALIFMFSLS